MAAELLGLQDSVGSISPNKSADLLILQGNPLEDVSILSDPQNIWAVYKSGVIVAGMEKKGVIGE